MWLSTLSAMEDEPVRAGDPAAGLVQHTSGVVPAFDDDALS